MIKTTAHPYIVQNEKILGGEPIIKGTRTPVRAIVEKWRRGTPPESIPDGLPHLTAAQVFDALSYYSDHQDEINAYIERNRIPDELIDPSAQMSIQEIEAAITKLSAEDLAILAAWFAEYRAQTWDKQIEHDLDAGRLDALLAEVDAEYEAGQAKPL